MAMLEFESDKSTVILHNLVGDRISTVSTVTSFDSFKSESVSVLHQPSINRSEQEQHQEAGFLLIPRWRL